MGIPSAGLQCMILGKQYSAEDPSVLDTIAQSGYASVECGASDPAQFRKMLDATGMTYAGMHLTPKALDDCDALVAKLGLLDGHDICNSGLLVWPQQQAADFRKTIAILNNAGKLLRRHSIYLHYHNHDFEFNKVEGERTGMDLLISELDPSSADLCVDVGWVTKGGLDPVKFLLDNRDKVGYLHLKDYDEQGWTELGRGVVNIKGVVGILDKLPNLRQVVVEQDSSRIDPLESIRISRSYLRDVLDY
jgi:sugar phosphate isomerase/epimerase